MVVDFGVFVLVNVYVPAVTSADAEEAEARSAFKRDFLTAVEIRYRALLAAGRRVVMCGDWNIAPTALDTAHAPPMTGPGAAEAFVRGNPSRAWLRRQLVGGRRRGERVRARSDGRRPWADDRRVRTTVSHAQRRVHVLERRRRSSRSRTTDLASITSWRMRARRRE